MNVGQKSAQKDGGKGIDALKGDPENVVLESKPESSVPQGIPPQGDSIRDVLHDVHANDASPGRDVSQSKPAIDTPHGDHSIRDVLPGKPHSKTTDIPPQGDRVGDAQHEDRTKDIPPSMNVPQGSPAVDAPQSNHNKEVDALQSGTSTYSKTTDTLPQGDRVGDAPHEDRTKDTPPTMSVPQGSPAVDAPQGNHNKDVDALQSGTSDDELLPL